MCKGQLCTIFIIEKEIYFQSNTFPERNTVYDFAFQKKSGGGWIDWMDTIDKSHLIIPPGSKVRPCFFDN